jgi:hypothetical protein
MIAQFLAHICFVCTFPKQFHTKNSFKVLNNWNERDLKHTLFSLLPVLLPQARKFDPHLRFRYLLVPNKSNYNMYHLHKVTMYLTGTDVLLLCLTGYNEYESTDDVLDHADTIGLKCTKAYEMNTKRTNKAPGSSGMI